VHIPDGFLSTPVWAALDVAAVPAIGYMARRAQRTFDESRVPLLGVMGAFVFAAQMINFPVGVGTSGHLVGSALLAYTVGPAAASVVMTAILAIQALVFQDGGVLALGANLINMAVIGVIAAYLPYRVWGGTQLRPLAIFLGGSLSLCRGDSRDRATIAIGGSHAWRRDGDFTGSVCRSGHAGRRHYSDSRAGTGAHQSAFHSTST
jgi:cobalt/nickel transport system permease protein